MGQKEDQLLSEALILGSETRDIHANTKEVLNGQNKMITKLANHTEKTTDGMKQAGKKLDKAVAQQSYGCMYITIGIELLLMIILVVYI